MVKTTMKTAAELPRLTFSDAGSAGDLGPTTIGATITALVLTAGQALQLAATEQNLTMIKSLQAQMKLYESGQPLHMPAN